MSSVVDGGTTRVIPLNIMRRYMPPVVSDPRAHRLQTHRASHNRAAAMVAKLAAEAVGRLAEAELDRRAMPGPAAWVATTRRRSGVPWLML